MVGGRGGLGPVLGQNFVNILSTFISANNKTFYLTGTDRKILLEFYFKIRKGRGGFIICWGILAKQK